MVVMFFRIVIVFSVFIMLLYSAIQYSTVVVSSFCFSHHLLKNTVQYSNAMRVGHIVVLVVRRFSDVLWLVHVSSALCMATSTVASQKRVRERCGWSKIDIQ